MKTLIGIPQDSPSSQESSLLCCNPSSLLSSLPPFLHPPGNCKVGFHGRHCAGLCLVCLQSDIFNTLNLNIFRLNMCSQIIKDLIIPSPHSHVPHLASKDSSVFSTSPPSFRLLSHAPFRCSIRRSHLNTHTHTFFTFPNRRGPTSPNPRQNEHAFPFRHCVSS